MEHASPFLRDLAVVLSLAALTGMVSQRFRLPGLVGYVVAGFLVGPAAPFTLVSDRETVRTLADLGVVLLMASVGIEFSIRKLARLGPGVMVVALVEVPLMLALGYGAAVLLGWSPREALFTGAALSISSTMIVAKLFENRPPDRSLRTLVIGVVVMEDLVAILLLALMGAREGSDGAVGELVRAFGRLGAFVAVVLGLGMLVIPRFFRFIARLRSNEATLVAAVGFSFLAATAAGSAGFSIALGAFLAGSLIRESGLGHQVAALIHPVRDMFGAIFFVAVGMLIEPATLLPNWPAVVLLTAVVIGGKLAGVSLGALLAGHDLRTSLRAGMSMAQIGEFSFLIAGLGLAQGSVGGHLFPVAVTVSVLTALLSPLMARAADGLSLEIDRHLPKPLQTLVCLYGSWIDLLRRPDRAAGRWSQVKGAVGWLVVDAVAVGGMVIGAALNREGLVRLLTEIGLGAGSALAVVWSAVALASAPFVLGIIQSARRLATRLAESAIAPGGKVDRGLWPRRVLAAALQFVVVLTIGLLLTAVTQPFVTLLPGLTVMLILLSLLGVSVFRQARDLQGHTIAGAELIVSALSKQGIDQTQQFEVVRELLPGLGDVVAHTILEGTPGVGQTLGHLNLRGLTGATIVALTRGAERIPAPGASEVLQVGDQVALTGSQRATAQATRLLSPPA
jgi:CPA2 family monovalent cation:H+ antiporter-2